MSKIGYIVALIMFLVLSGCATSNYSIGKEFSSDNVTNIKRGQTTTAQLLEWFGEPFSKTVISGTDEKWIYMYSSGTATASSGLLSMKMESKGTQKTLDILISNGVVVNYAFTEGSGPYNYNVQ